MYAHNTYEAMRAYAVSLSVFPHFLYLNSRPLVSRSSGILGIPYASFMRRGREPRYLRLPFCSAI